MGTYQLKQQVYLNLQELPKLLLQLQLNMKFFTTRLLNPWTKNSNQSKKAARM